MVVATEMAGWAQRKPSQGTAGVTSSEWGLCCLTHTHIQTLLLVFSFLPFLTPRLFQFTSIGLQWDPTWPCGFCISTLFSSVILLTDLGNSSCIVPIDGAYKESGSSHSMSQYVRRGVSISGLDGICLHPFPAATAVHLYSKGKEALSFHSGDLCNERKKTCPCFDLKSWTGQGRKNDFGSKEYNQSDFMAGLLLSYAGTLHHAVRLIWFPHAQGCEFGPWIGPQAGCSWSLILGRCGQRSIHTIILHLEWKLAKQTVLLAHS